MKAPYEKYTVVWAWKLHVDTGKPNRDLPPKIVKDENGRIVEEIHFFNVEGKKRPAIVWTSNTEKTKLIMLTTQGSSHVIKLGTVLDNRVVCYFAPDRRLWQRYPNELIDSDAGQLADDLRQLLHEELSVFEMTVQPNGNRGGLR